MMTRKGVALLLLLTVVLGACERSEVNGLVAIG